MDNDSSEIKSLKTIVWRTAIANRAERFATLLGNADAQGHFDEDYIMQLTSKIDRFFRMIFGLTVIYTVLIVLLYIAQLNDDAEFQIFGYSFKNLGHYKEFLLLVAAAIAPVTSYVSAYRQYLLKLRSVVLEKIFPDSEIREFKMHAYSDEFFDALFKNMRSPLIREHKIALCLSVFLIFGTLVFVLALVIASFILQLAVIYDVVKNPSLPQYINIFVVACSLCSIMLSWLISILQLPMPEVDERGYLRLAQLKVKDKSRYDAAIMRIAHESKKSERRKNDVASVVIFFGIYCIIAVFPFIDIKQDILAHAFKLLLGGASIIFVGDFASDKLKRILYAPHLHKDEDGDDLNVKAFLRAIRLAYVMKYMLIIALSVMYSVIARG